MAYDEKDEVKMLFEDEPEFFDEPDGNVDDTEEPGADDLLGGSESQEEGEPEQAEDDKLSSQRVRPGGIKGGQGMAPKSFKTYVDIVFVIDCTGSMQPFLNLIKDHAKTMHEDIKAGLGTVGRQVEKLRLKVIAYRDYFYDYVDPDHPPMLESDFFTMPDDMDAYARFVDALEWAGGEDEPESALEALHVAFNSDWQRVQDKDVRTRQVIMLFTDASAHPLDDPMRDNPEFNEAYPQDMPRTLAELEDEYMSPEVFPANADGIPTGHRLVLFAPENMYPWKDVKGWEASDCKTMDPEKGLEGVDMDDVIELIKGSIS